MMRQGPFQAKTTSLMEWIAPASTILSKEALRGKGLDYFQKPRNAKAEEKKG